MFNNNNGVLTTGCAQFGVAENSDAELSEISSAILSVSANTGVDPRFIFAIVMQESNGCVRAPTTNYGVTNPGLMQSHDGSGSCNNGGIQNPCPQSEVTQMIEDGTSGTSSGWGLVQCLANAGTTDVSQYYIAARIYNSGSVAAGGNLGQGVATHCYASDVANRLVGWSSGASACTPDAVAALTSSVVNANSANTGSTDTTTTTSASPVVTSSVSVIPVPAATSVASAPPAAATTHASTPVTPSTPAPPAADAPATGQIYPGAVSPCSSYYLVVAGDYCNLVAQKTGISFATLRTLNSGLDATCSNLWLGYKYCVQA
jgi:LysM repeat protein